MTTKNRILFCLAASCLLIPAAAAQTRSFLKVGDKVPALEGNDSNGEALSWDRWDKLAVILYFHSPDMAYSTRGLAEFATEVKPETELLKKLAVLVVSSSNSGLDKVEKALGSLGLPFAITVDAGRSNYRPYRVVAFPTAFFLNADRTLTYIRKGYGPPFSTQLVAGARLSAGMIDEAAFKDAISPRQTMAKSGNDLMLARTVRMARQQVTAGMLADARKSLEAVITPSSNSADGVALLARVLLLQKQAAAARPWVIRLERLTPKSRDLRVLKAMLLLEENKPAEAEEELLPLDGRQPEIAMLRGRALEQRGKFKEAAEIYRRALTTLLEKTN